MALLQHCIHLGCANAEVTEPPTVHTAMHWIFCSLQLHAILSGSYPSRHPLSLYACAHQTATFPYMPATEPCKWPGSPFWFALASWTASVLTCLCHTVGPEFTPQSSMASAGYGPVCLDPFPVWEPVPIEDSAREARHRSPSPLESHG